MDITNTDPDSDLDLIGLDMQEVGRLDNETWWDYEHQIQHHCIRLAWRKAVLKRLPVRECLNVIYAKKLIASEHARGNAIDSVALSAGLEQVRRYHELNLCLGFFVDAEAERVFAGATSPTYPSPRSILTPRYLGVQAGQFTCYMFSARILSLLQKQLAAPGRDRHGEFVDETVRCVEGFAQGPKHAYVSPRLEKLIEMAEERAAVERRIAEAGKAHLESKFRA